MGHKNRRKQVVRSGHPASMATSLIGAIILYSVAILMGFPVTNSTCTARVFLTHAGFALLLMPLLVKTYAIKKIMSSKAMSKYHVTSAQMMSYTAGYTVFVVLLVAILFAATETPTAQKTVPPWIHDGKVRFPGWDADNEYKVLLPVGQDEIVKAKPDFVKEDNVIERVKFCYSDDTANLVAIVVQSMLLVAAVYLAVETKNMPTKFNESSYIGYAIYNIFLTMLFVTGLLPSVSDYSPSFESACLGIGAVSASTGYICMLILPKLLATWDGSAEATRGQISLGVSSKTDSIRVDSSNEPDA